MGCRTMDQAILGWGLFWLMVASTGGSETAVRVVDRKPGDFKPKPNSDLGPKVLVNRSKSNAKPQIPLFTFST